MISKRTLLVPVSSYTGNGFNQPYVRVSVAAEPWVKSDQPKIIETPEEAPSRRYTKIPDLSNLFDKGVNSSEADTENHHG